LKDSSSLHLTKAPKRLCEYCKKHIEGRPNKRFCSEANLAFEQKAKNIRLGLQDEAAKTALEKLEERKWIIQTATQMLKQEGILPEQQPRLSIGVSIHDLVELDEKVDLIKGAVVDALQDRYLDHDQRKNDYDEGRWGQVWGTLF